ncbi:MAG TPA: pyridoxal-phosphate dependent enzyme, partial [Vicinamibacteria bacterium]|nr:pyridoxal-phosphate dependent enzyme [Vicinamibacteria bacterium]
FAAEIETAAPLAASLSRGEPSSVDYVRSFVDGIGSRTVLPIMFERGRRLLDGALAAGLREVASAICLLVERHRIVAEGAGAASVACALGEAPSQSKVVCVISGGNIGLDALQTILGGGLPA